MDRRREHADWSVNLGAGILAAALFGIFAVVFIYNYSGERATFTSNNPPIAAGQYSSAGSERAMTSGQSTPE